MVVLRAELSSCKTDFKDYKVSNIYSLALDSRSCTLLEEKQALLDHRRKKLYFHETLGAWFRKTKGLDKSDTSSFCLILMLNEGAESPCHPAGQGLNSGLPMLKEAAGGQCRLPKEGLSSACPPHHSKWPLNSP
jgi:hypothetical protein